MFCIVVSSTSSLQGGPELWVLAYGLSELVSQTCSSTTFIPSENANGHTPRRHERHRRESGCDAVLSEYNDNGEHFQTVSPERHSHCCTRSFNMKSATNSWVTIANKRERQRGVQSQLLFTSAHRWPITVWSGCQYQMAGPENCWTQPHFNRSRVTVHCH